MTHVKNLSFCEASDDGDEDGDETEMRRTWRT